MRAEDNVKERYQLAGCYVRGLRHTHKKDVWEQICEKHEEEFPEIRRCAPGTFNVRVTSPAGWHLPLDDQFRALAKRRGHGPKYRYYDGNYVSPLVLAVNINGRQVEAWFYAGSQNHRREGIVELISKDKIVKLLGLVHMDPVQLVVTEFWIPCGGMPAPPPGV